MYIYTHAARISTMKNREKILGGGRAIMINEMKIGRNLGERRRHPNMLQRKKYHLTPAGRRALLKIKVIIYS